MAGSVGSRESRELEEDLQEPESLIYNPRKDSEYLARQQRQLVNMRAMESRPLVPPPVLTTKKSPSDFNKCFEMGIFCHGVLVHRSNEDRSLAYPDELPNEYPNRIESQKHHLDLHAQSETQPQSTENTSRVKRWKKSLSIEGKARHTICMAIYTDLFRIPFIPVVKKERNLEKVCCAKISIMIPDVWDPVLGIPANNGHAMEFFLQQWDNYILAHKNLRQLELLINLPKRQPLLEDSVYTEPEEHQKLLLYNKWVLYTAGLKSLERIKIKLVIAEAAWQQSHDVDSFKVDGTMNYWDPIPMWTPEARPPPGVNVPRPSLTTFESTAQLSQPVEHGVVRSPLPENFYTPRQHPESPINETYHTPRFEPPSPQPEAFHTPGHQASSPQSSRFMTPKYQPSTPMLGQAFQSSEPAGTPVLRSAKSFPDKLRLAPRQVDGYFEPPPEEDEEIRNSGPSRHMRIPKSPLAYQFPSPPLQQSPLPHPPLPHSPLPSSPLAHSPGVFSTPRGPHGDMQSRTYRPMKRAVPSTPQHATRDPGRYPPFAPVPDSARFKRQQTPTRQAGAADYLMSPSPSSPQMENDGCSSAWADSGTAYSESPTAYSSRPYACPAPPSPKFMREAPQYSPRQPDTSDDSIPPSVRMELAMRPDRPVDLSPHGLGLMSNEAARPLPTPPRRPRTPGQTVPVEPAGYPMPLATNPFNSPDRRKPAQNTRQQPARYRQGRPFQPPREGEPF